jgi:hypothetical protein
MTKIPLVDRLEKDPLEVIRTGNFVKVDAGKSMLTLTRK